MLYNGLRGCGCEGFREFIRCCAPVRGSLGGVVEGVDAAAIPALCSGLVEFDLFEELVAERVAEEASVFEDFVAGVLPLVGVLLFLFRLEEGFGGDEAVGVVEDGFFDDGFGGEFLDGGGVAAGVAAGYGAGFGAGGEAAAVVLSVLGFRQWLSAGLGFVHDRLLRQGAEGDLQAVEEEAGAARVDVVVGDGVHDLSDGGADAVAVFGGRS